MRCVEEVHLLILHARRPPQVHMLLVPFYFVISRDVVVVVAFVVCFVWHTLR